MAMLAWIGAETLDAYRTVALRAGSRGVCDLVLRGKAIDVRCGDGSLREGELRDGSFVAPFLTIVRWRPRHARFDRSIVILPDMLERDAFRRLRVALKWSRA